MSMSSMLTIDRRRETRWLAVVVAILIVQILPFLLNSAHLLWLLQLTLSSVCLGLLVLSATWSMVRAFRLVGERPIGFILFLFCYGISSLVFAFMLLLYTHWPHVLYSMYELAIAISIFFVVLSSWQICCSLLYLFASPSRAMLRNIAMPVYKPVHLGILLLAAFALMFHLKMIFFTLFCIAHYLAIRYSFNRWIFMKSTRFPFQAVDAKRFIRQATA